MPEPLVSNRSVYWKRPLIGGLISALIAGICFGLFLYDSRLLSGSVLSFILLGFGAPAFITSHSSRVIAVLTVIVFWFLVGAIISYLARKNIIAIGVWIVIYAISFALSLAIFAEINN